MILKSLTYCTHLGCPEKQISKGSMAPIKGRIFNEVKNGLETTCTPKNKAREAIQSRIRLFLNSQLFTNHLIFISFFRKFLTVSGVLILFLVSVVTAQVPAPKAVVKPAIFDFGKVAPGALIEASFTIFNEGNAPLDIQKIVPSCGCMAPSLAKNTIAPGESEILSAKFNSKGFFGPQVKNVRLYTNDPQANSLLLTFRGEVARDFKIEPAQFYFGDVLSGSERKVKIQLSSNSPEVKFGEVALKSESFTTEIFDREKGGLAVKTIELALKPDAPIGVIRSIVLVHTNSVNEPVISVPVFAKIQGELQLSPSYISFDLLEAPLSGPVSRTVDLKNVGDDFPSIISIESDNPFVSGSFKVLKSGKLFEIQILLSEESNGVVRARLTINTDRLDESRKSVTLPVYAFVARKGE